MSPTLPKHSLTEPNHKQWPQNRDMKWTVNFMNRCTPTAKSLIPIFQWNAMLLLLILWGRAKTMYVHTLKLLFMQEQCQNVLALYTNRSCGGVVIYRLLCNSSTGAAHLSGRTVECVCGCQQLHIALLLFHCDFNWSKYIWHNPNILNLIWNKVKWVSLNTWI